MLAALNGHTDVVAALMTLDTEELKGYLEQTDNVLHSTQRQCTAQHTQTMHCTAHSDNTLHNTHRQCTAQ